MSDKARCADCGDPAVFLLEHVLGQSGPQVWVCPPCMTRRKKP